MRSDFPTARRGYDPAAVEAHLRRVSDELGGASDAALADVAAERVRSILEVAEAKAREIETDARREADEVLSAARAQAREHVERAQSSVAKLIGQADELRERIGAMAKQVGAEAGLGETQAAQAETEPEPEPVPEPSPPQPEVDPTPVTVPEPAPAREPEPEPPPIPEPQPGPPPAAGNGAHEQAARLVAMKMALDGSSREEIAQHLADNYELANPEELLDAVLERAGR